MGFSATSCSRRRGCPRSSVRFASHGTGFGTARDDVHRAADFDSRGDSCEAAGSGSSSPRTSSLRRRPFPFFSPRRPTPPESRFGEDKVRPSRRCAPRSASRISRRPANLGEAWSTKAEREYEPCGWCRHRDRVLGRRNEVVARPQRTPGQVLGRRRPAAPAVPGCRGRAGPGRTDRGEQRRLDLGEGERPRLAAAEDPGEGDERRMTALQSAAIGGHRRPSSSW